MVGMPKSYSLSSVPQAAYSDYLWMERHGHPVSPPTLQQEQEHYLSYVSKSGIIYYNKSK